MMKSSFEHTVWRSIIACIILAHNWVKHVDDRWNSCLTIDSWYIHVLYGGLISGNNPIDFLWP